MYVVSKPTFMLMEQVVAGITGPSVGLADLETMLKRLLPTVPAQAPPPRPAPTDIKAMLKCLLPTQAPQSHPVTARRDWSLVLYFSGGTGWANAHG